MEDSAMAVREPQNLDEFLSLPQLGQKQGVAKSPPKKHLFELLPQIYKKKKKKKRAKKVREVGGKAETKGKTGGVVKRVVKAYLDRKKELLRWGRSMSFREKQFRKKFELLDTNMCKRLKVDAFRSVLRRIGAMSERRLEEVVTFLDPNKSGMIPYFAFLDLIAPLKPPHVSPELSAYALSKMSPVLAKCPVLLGRNPIRKRSNQMTRLNYEQILNSGLRHRLERRNLVDPMKRRRDFELFLLKYQVHTGH